MESGDTHEDEKTVKQQYDHFNLYIGDTHNSRSKLHPRWSDCYAFVVYMYINHRLECSFSVHVKCSNKFVALL